MTLQVLKPSGDAFPLDGQDLRIWKECHSRARFMACIMLASCSSGIAKDGVHFLVYPEQEGQLNGRSPPLLSGPSVGITHTIADTMRHASPAGGRGLWHDSPLRCAPSDHGLAVAHQPAG